MLGDDWRPAELVFGSYIPLCRGIFCTNISGRTVAIAYAVTGYINGFAVRVAEKIRKRGAISTSRTRRHAVAIILVTIILLNRSNRL